MAPAWQQKVMVSNSTEFLFYCSQKTPPFQNYFRSPRKPRSPGSSKSAGDSGCRTCKKAKRSLQPTEVELNTEPIAKQVARCDEDTATENIPEEECAGFVKVKPRTRGRIIINRANGGGGGVGNRPTPILRQSTSLTFRSRRRPLTKQVRMMSFISLSVTGCSFVLDILSIPFLKGCLTACSEDACQVGAEEAPRLRWVRRRRRRQGQRRRGRVGRLEVLRLRLPHPDRSDQERNR